MKNFIKVAGGLNVSWALEEISSKPGWWQDITARQETPGTCHHDTETIFFRWSKDPSIEAVFNDLEAVNYPAMDELSCIKEMIMKVHELVGGELGRAILVKLKSGGSITPHIDEGPYAEHYDRFHLPIVSKMGNNFYVSNDEQCGEYCWIQPGELWWFDHRKEHFAVNSSDGDRIHLIVDIKTDQYRGGNEVSNRAD